MTPGTPWWIFLSLAALSFVAGFASGSTIVLWRWLRTQNPAVLPLTFSGSALGVRQPPRSAEQDATEMSEANAIRYGATELLSQAKAAGIPMSFDDAEQQARAALRGAFDPV